MSINLNNTDAVVNAVRYAVKSEVTWQTFVTDNGITREDVADVARTLAALAFPKDEPVQKTDGKRTRFGNAVQAAGNGMRRALDNLAGDEETDEEKAVKAVNLITREGAKASLEAVTAAWHAAQK